MLKPQTSSHFSAKSATTTTTTATATATGFRTTYQSIFYCFSMVEFHNSVYVGTRWRYVS